MRVCAVIQARMESKRLPGKVLMDINGMPLIQHIWRRLQRCNGVDSVVVSAGMSWGDVGTQIQDHCEQRGIAVQSCAEEDVLLRLFRAATKTNSGAVVRITADCLFHDPALIDVGIMKFVSEYPKNLAVFNWPRRIHSEGLDFEVWSTELLAKLDQRKDVDRENVAQWAWERRKELGIGSLWKTDENDGAPHLSIDTREDLNRAGEILADIGNDEWRYHKTLESYRKLNPTIEVVR